MKPDDFDTNLSILELPSLLTQLFERANRPLLPGATQPVRLFVRYLRRKSGRGLAVIYSVGEVQSMGNRATSHKAPGNNPYRSVSLTLDEKALDGAHIRFSAAQANLTALEAQPSGVLCATEIGLSVQAFPADSHLPALAADRRRVHPSVPRGLPHSRPVHGRGRPRPVWPRRLPGGHGRGRSGGVGSPARDPPAALNFDFAGPA